MDILFQHEVSGRGINPEHSELRGMRRLANRHDVSHRGYDMASPCALLAVRNDQDSLSLEQSVHTDSGTADSTDTLGAHRKRQSGPDALGTASQTEVGRIDRSRLHRNEYFSGTGLGLAGHSF